MRNHPLSLVAISAMSAWSGLAAAQASPSPQAAPAPAAAAPATQAPSAAPPAAAPTAPLPAAGAGAAPQPAVVPAPAPEPAGPPDHFGHHWHEQDGIPGHDHEHDRDMGHGHDHGMGIELMSLRLMREKGVISEAEFDSAMHDLKESTGMHAPDEGTVVMGKWSTTLYGFVEADYIYDTTRAFNDLAGSALVPRPAANGGTNAGDNGRMTMGIRNSRVGFRLKAPELSCGVRTSAMVEMDFQGVELPVGSAQPYQGSEGTFFTSPTARVRHLNLKVETPVVDFLAGQYWSVFGWGSAYQPNTVEIQGVPGEIYARIPQLRISKTIKAQPVTVEVAVAATRPVQRDSATPDGQGGIRFSLDSWTGVQTTGSTGTQIAPLSVAVTGLLRHVAVDAFSAKPKTTNDLGLSAIAFDAYIPIIPGTKHRRDNAFSVNGEFATGYGYADMYSGLTGGMTTYATPKDATAAAPAYTPNIDNGIVTYDGLGHLHGIQYQTYLLGAQYYLPGTNGKLWISGNYSHVESNNMHFYTCAVGCSTTAAKALSVYDWFDLNVFVDPTPAVRVGFEYANFNTQYVDGVHAINHRGQLSGFFIF
jgi:hypothetical protein